MSKKITCCTLVTNSRVVLLGHPTGSNFWEPPKGLMEENETPKEAAHRELFEETGINAPLELLDDNGHFFYNKHKDLHLFIYRPLYMPNILDIKCTSTFIDKDGIEKCELDTWMYVPWEDVKTLVLPHMWNILKNFNGEV